MKKIFFCRISYNKEKDIYIDIYKIFKESKKWLEYWGFQTLR